MWGGQPNMTGKNFDQFMYAAMVSRARIEYLWSGQANDAEEADVPEEAKAPDAPAFDPEMLKKLAQKAADGEAIEEPSTSAPSKPNFGFASSAPRDKFAGFSKEVIAAAKALEKPAHSAAGAEGNSFREIPAAFRKKAPPSSEGDRPPSVPLAFMKRSSPMPTVTIQAGNKPDNFIGDWKGKLAEPYDPAERPDAKDGSLEDLKRSFQERVEQTQQALDKAREKGAEAEAKANQDSAEQKDKDAAAVRNIVSLKLAQAHKSVEATKSFHASAPEPREQGRRRRSGWGGDDVKAQDDKAEPEQAQRDTSDMALDKAPRSDSYRAGGEARSSNSSALTNISRRELAALARGDPNPDAPVLGELRAPGKSERQNDTRDGKTGAQVVRESRQRAQGYHRRSRSRDRPKRARSPSSSPERGGKKKLFTATPSYRLTGSTFSSAPPKPEEAKPKAAGAAAPNLKEQGDLPDWLKDLAEPQAVVPAQPKLGKKYLHMPRIMVEVLTHNGGEAVRTCEQRSQCQIRVETMIEEPVGIVSVNGNVGLGESIIRETLANKGLDLPPQDGLVLPYAPVVQQKSMTQQQDVQIPDAMVKHFLGHKGCNMKALHAELDRRHGGARTVSIQILPSILPGGFRRIQITGSNRLEAQQLILQHIEDVKREQSAFSDTRGGVQMAPQPEAPPQSVGIRI